MNRLKELEQFGQSVWLDFVRRELLTGGGLEALIANDGLKGVTSNPAIFEKAIGEGAEYRGALEAAVRAGDTDPERIYERLAVEDIAMAADQLAKVHAATGGRDGFVSLEVSPRLAHDTEATVAAARRLWAAVKRQNLMIKVPATPAGVPAIERLIAEGINVNVTLLFAVETYREVAHAFRRGLERRLREKKPVDNVASVASFFVSRIDTEVDAILERRVGEASGTDERCALEALHGKAAIANARLAYAAYLEIIAGEPWRAVAARGARTQRLLWGSTGTKNPAYPDTLYVDELIGPDTVNTMPPATLDAFRDHGMPKDRLTGNLPQARDVTARLAAAGVDMNAVTAKLLDDGVRLFDEAYGRLLGSVQRARRAA
ncbi:MAG TPA: transaldolase [Burkholderiales bacterium]|nr:transaldolase [Burkholderiales bacterium]